MDTKSKEQRSRNMARIRSADTKPELTVRKYLFSKGLRYRKNDARYPGKPDLVFPKYRTAVFVNGCFWHQHEGCRRANIPKSRQDYWIPKLERTKRRDEENRRKLEEMGWNVITVWECELKEPQFLEDLYRRILGI